MTTLEPITTPDRANAIKLPESDSEDRADVLERQMLENLLNGDTNSVPGTELPVIHHCGAGIYIRELHMPAGMVVVGHRHTEDGMNVMLTGKMALINESGELEYLEAPQTFESKAGVRKAAYIMEEVIWQNVFATKETDVATLEDQLIEKSEAFKAFEQYQLESDNLLKEEAI